MSKIIHTIVNAVPTLIQLFKSKTPAHGKAIVKSGLASVSIAGLISTGKVSASDIDATLLLILSILEAAGYLYGLIAISSGAAQRT